MPCQSKAEGDDVRAFEAAVVLSEEINETNIYTAYPVTRNA